MTLQDSPHLTETPVRYLTELRPNAFFCLSYNREFVRGRREYATVSNPLYQIKEIGVYLWLGTVLTMIVGMVGLGVAASWLPSTVLAYLLLVGIAIVGPSFLMDRYSEYFNRQVSRRFQREGKIIQGEVVHYTVSSSYMLRPIGSTLVVKVIYCFESRFDESIRGESVELRTTIEGQQLPASGTPVYILYFSDDEHYPL